MGSTEDFLGDFDKRREAASGGRKRGDPAPDGEAAEHGELLDFADLVRERCSPEDLKLAEAKAKLVEKLGAAERSARLRRLLVWAGPVAAAAACLVVGLVLGLRGRPDAGKLARPGQRKGTIPGARRAVASGPVDEFAGAAFPEVRPLEATGAREAEVPFEKDLVRLVRSRGLILVRRAAKKAGPRWRLLRRRGVLEPGDWVRASRRHESGAIFRGPEGSRVMLSAGARVKYVSPRGWRLEEGSAQFDAASGAGLADFVVETPHGRLVAKGTQFVASVQVGSTVLSVRSGRVAASARGGAGIELAKGEAARLGGGTARRITVPSSWRESLGPDPAADHGIGELLARAVDDKAADMLPLEIKSHRVTVTVVHPVARTFIDEVFVNNTDRRMEGVFYYTLPPDAAVSEFAMYVNGKRILGEVLERHRARQVFEYIRRQRRDPALLEWVGGNLFKMRVFPIEPHSEKRIQLGYTQVLRRDRGTVTYSYPLVSEKLVKNPLRELGIEFRVASSQGLVGLSCTSHRAESVLTDDGRGALGFGARDYTPKRDFTVTYRVDEGAELVAFANSRPDEEEAYFLLEIAPKVDLPFREPGRRMLVIVDGSPSVGAQGFALAAEFASVAADFSLGWELGVIVAGAEVEKWQEGFVQIDADTPEKLRTFLSGRRLIGATDLYAAFRTASEMVAGGPSAEIVYVGDGIDTLGELEGSALVREIASLFRNAEVRGSCVAVGAAYDEPFLRSLAGALGGSCVRVREATSLFGAADGMLERVSRPVLSNVRLSFKGFETSAVLPPSIAALPAGSSDVVVGRMKQGGEGTVALRGRVEDEEFERSYRLVLEPDAGRNRFVPRLWARAKIEDLMSGMGLAMPADDARIRQDVIATSVKYQIMSPLTAFLVLESEDDYRRYGIRRRLKMWDWKGDEGGIEFAARGPMTAMKRKSGLVRMDRLAGPAASAPVAAAEKPAFAKAYWAGNKAEAEASSFESFAFEDRRKLSPAEPVARDNMETGGGGDWWWGDRGARGQEDAISNIPLGTGLVGNLGVGGGSSGSYGFRSGGGRRRAALRGGGSRRGGPISLGGSSGAAQCYPLVLHSGEVAGLTIDSPRRASWEYVRLSNAGRGTLETQLNLALSLESEGRFRNALKALAPVIEKHSREPELHLERAVLSARAGDDEGMQRAFARAVEVAEDEKRAQIEQRVPQLLTNLQRNTRAAEAYEKLARAATDANTASGHYQMAASYFTNAQKRDRARELWEGALDRFPENARLRTAAGQWYLRQGNDPTRALELYRRARELGAKATAELVQALAGAGEREEARKLVREIVAAAKNRHEIYSVLYSLRNYDQTAATAEALRLLQSKPGSPDAGEGRSSKETVAGVVQYLQSYGRGSADVLKAVLEAARREDFPPEARQQAFHLLWNSGRRGKEATGVLEPLFEDTSTPEAVQRAVNAVSSFIYNAPKEALVCIEKLLALDGMEKYHASLVSSKWQVLQRLGRKDEAERAMESAFKEAKDENSAYQPAWQLFWARLNRGEADGAIDIILAFEKRFPDSRYLAQMYQQLFQNLRRRGKKDEIAELVERLAKAHPDDPSYALNRAKRLAGESKFREAAGLLRETLAKVAETRAALEKDKPADAGPAPNAKDFPETKDFQAAHAEWWKKEQASRQWRSKREAAHRARCVLIVWLGRVSSQDEELKAQFMKEAEEQAKSEDPVDREWTEGVIACLEAPGDEAAFLARLEKLVRDEPRDPLWPYRLGYGYLRAGKLEEGRAALSKLLESDPGDADLALTLHSVALRLRDAPAAERYRAHAFEALAKQPNRLQQLAYQWQQGRPEWALEAWRALSRLDQWQQNAYAAFQAAQFAQKLGRTEEAAEFYFDALAAGRTTYSHHGRSAVQQLAAMAKEETVLVDLERRLKEAFEGEPRGAQALYLRVLAYRFRKIRGRDEAAAAELSAATKIDIQTGHHYAGRALVEALVAEGRGDEAESYALSGGGNLPRQVRHQLIRNAASRFQHDQKNWPRAVRLYRKLLEEPDNNQQNDQRSLIQALVRGKKLDQAEKELERMEPGRNSWSVQSAYQSVSSGWQNRGDYDRAVKLALKGWRKLRHDPSGYRNSMLSHVNNICYQALRQRRGGLSAEVREEVKELLVEAARDSFAGDAPSGTYWHHGNVLEKLGIGEKIGALALEAARSEAPNRLMAAAKYYQNKGDRERARSAYRRALDLGGEKRQILQNLYNLSVHHHVKDWESALDYLDPLKELGAYDEFRYLQERGRCLYGLGRRDEAREALRKALRAPQHARNHWRVGNLASYAQQAKDHEMAAELWEKQVRVLKATGQLQSYHVWQYYSNLARAYAQMGRDKDAIDAYLRGMSLIKRSDGHYRHFLNSLREHVFKKGGIDAAVERYEEALAKDRAERPHLRIAFGEAYKRARRTKEALAQFSIAADLMPKDMSLRREVIDGYRKLGLDEAAIEAYFSWAKLDPQNIDVYKGLGDLYQSLGRTKEARAAWATMAEARPREASGRRAYAKVLLGLGGREATMAAARELRRALRYRPTEFEIAKELAGVYESLGPKTRGLVPALWTAGEAACRQSIKDLPDDPLPWLNLGRFLHEQGRARDERELYREIIARPWPRFRWETVREARRRLTE